MASLVARYGRPAAHVTDATDDALTVDADDREKSYNRDGIRPTDSRRQLRDDAVMDTDLIEEHLRQADAVLSLLELALDGGGQAPGVDTIVGAVQAAATNVRKARELVLDDSPGLPPATP